MKKMYRQGDVLLVRQDAAEGVECAREKMVLAEGEVTGHKHVMSGTGVVFYRAGGGQVQVQVPRGADLVHEEHAKIHVPAGRYAVVLQRELSLSEQVRKVSD